MLQAELAPAHAAVFAAIGVEMGAGEGSDCVRKSSLDSAGEWGEEESDTETGHGGVSGVGTVGVAEEDLAVGKLEHGKLAAAYKQLQAELSSAQAALGDSLQDYNRYVGWMLSGGLKQV